MGILEKNIILGSANASPNMIFFKDPIYFRITPPSVLIGVFRPTRNSYGEVTIIGEGLQILTFIWHF